MKKKKRKKEKNLYAITITLLISLKINRISRLSTFKLTQKTKNSETQKHSNATIQKKKAKLAGEEGKLPKEQQWKINK